MILDGIEPSSILLFTFTNKAAREIKERIVKGVGEDNANKITMGTYHSFCCKLLRKYADRLGYKRNFSILDIDDSDKILKKITKDSQIDYKFLGSYIDGAKRNFLTPQQALTANTNTNATIANMYEQYQKELKSMNCMDFNCLIFNTVKLLETDSDVKNQVNNRYKYISCDEFHDSSSLDIRLISLLAGEEQNVCHILDDAQCLIPGTVIETDKGPKKIEDITIDDNVLVAAGKGSLSFAKPESISSKYTKEVVYTIKTGAGREITGTAGHIAFSKIRPAEECYYVYLMYKHGYGFRIGRTSNARKRRNGVTSNGFESRLNQEGADKIWIIDRSNNLQQSMMMESYYSYKYGIPQYVFKNNGNRLGLSQENIDLLYSKLDTIDAGKKLLANKNMFYEYPHYTPRMRFGSTNRKKLTFTMFAVLAKSGKRYLHRTDTSTQDISYSEFIAKKTGSKTYRSAKNGKEYYINSVANMDYDKQWASISEIEKEMNESGENFDVVIQAKMTSSPNERYNFTPFSHLIKGSYICVKDGETIIEDKIVSIESNEYNGLVYDINIPYYRNYVANDIVTHNSIYSFRGANIKAVLGSINLYKDTKLYYLNQNYRCSNTIVEASKSIISNNSVQLDKNIFTTNDVGDKIIVYEESTPAHEGVRIAKTIELLVSKYGKKYKDIAILYRTSSQSRPIEEAFIKTKIPYCILSGINFFQREEIKTLVSYFKIIMNTNNFEAFRRSVNLPRRGIGDATIEKVIEEAKSYIEPLDVVTAINSCIDKGIIKGKSKDGLKRYLDILYSTYCKLDDEGIPEALAHLINEIDYYAFIEQNDKSGEVYETKIENVLELINMSYEFDTIEEFIEQASLGNNEDALENDYLGKVQLLTMHMSKGLEWDNVFIIGCNEGTTPHFKSLSSPSQYEEERRCFYVAVTRAKENLFLTRALKVNNGGFFKATKISPFVQEIDSSLIHSGNHR